MNFINSDKQWNWVRISCNDFNYYFKKKRDSAARKIQKAWHDYWYVPNSEGIVRCAERSFDEFSRELSEMK